MNKLSALNKVEEYMTEDLSWLKTGAREDTDWLMFVAYRIKAMMLNSVYKKNQAIMTYEKQELNEDYNDFLDMLWTMQDSGIFKFDWDRIWKQRDYQEIVDNIGLVTERFGYGVAVDLMKNERIIYKLDIDSEDSAGINTPVKYVYYFNKGKVTTYEAEDVVLGDFKGLNNKKIIDKLVEALKKKEVATFL